MEQFRMIYNRWDELPQPRKMKLLRVVAFASYSIALLFFVIYAFGGISKRTKNPEPVVLFMEAMPGSFSALHYLAKRRDVSVLMIVLTISGWSADLNSAYDNTAAFLAALRSDGVLSYDIPIYYGHSVARANAHFIDEISFSPPARNTTSCTYRRVLSPELLLDANRLFGAASLLTAPSSGSLAFFEDPLRVSLAKAAASFLVLGPATDAAAFLEAHSQSRASVSAVYFAAGAISAAGDARLVYPPNRDAEMSAFLDPRAAHGILRGAFGRPVVLLPADAAPLWPPALYARLVTARVALAALSAPSAGVVAASGAAMRERLGAGGDAPRLDVQTTAAAYFADVRVREEAVVSEAFLAVINGESMATDGRVGTPSAATQQTGQKVKMVLQLVNSTFWTQFENVDKL